MQIDTELIGVLSGIVSSILTSAVGFGVVKHKVERLEKDMEEANKKYVSNELFNATIQPLKEDIRDIKNDLHALLKLATREN